MNEEKNLWEKITFKLKNYKIVVLILILVGLLGLAAKVITDSKTIYKEIKSLDQCDKEVKKFKENVTKLAEKEAADLASADIKSLQSGFVKLMKEYCDPVDSKIETLSKEFKNQVSLKIGEQFEHIEVLKVEKGDEYFEGINGVKEVEKLSTLLESYKVICHHGNLEFKEFCTDEEIKRITQTLNDLQ